MAKLIYSERAFVDLERLTDFLVESDPLAAAETVGLIEEAVALLGRHPLIGRPVRGRPRPIRDHSVGSGIVPTRAHRPAGITPP